MSNCAHLCDEHGQRGAQAEGHFVGERPHPPQHATVVLLWRQGELRRNSHGASSINTIPNNSLIRMETHSLITLPVANEKSRIPSDHQSAAWL